MPTEEKVRTVDDIADKLRRAVSLVVTDYRGLTVDQLQDLRRRLHAANVDYVVVKNTLARRAADDSGLVALKEDLNGPVALAIGYDDPLLSPRLVNDYIRQTRRLVIKAGLLGAQRVSSDEVRRIAELPSREALLGQLAGTLNYSVARLAGALEGAMVRLGLGLRAYQQKLETETG